MHIISNSILVSHRTYFRFYKRDQNTTSCVTFLYQSKPPNVCKEDANEALSSSTCSKLPPRARCIPGGQVVLRSSIQFQRWQHWPQSSHYRSENVSTVDAFAFLFPIAIAPFARRLTRGRHLYLVTIWCGRLEAGPIYHTSPFPFPGSLQFLCGCTLHSSRCRP